MIENLTSDFTQPDDANKVSIAGNLADLAIQKRHGSDDIATEIAATLLTQYYTADNTAFDSSALKPLSFRDGAMHQAIEKLSAVEHPTTEQASQLKVLKSAVTLEADILLNSDRVPVAPDIHHWDFTRSPAASALNAPYSFNGPGKRPLIEAWPELRFAGILSNPYDPSKPEFDAGFVLNPVRLQRQAQIVSKETGLDETRLLQTVFVNAAQVMGRRIVQGTPEGQVGPSYWVELADSAKKAMEPQP